MGPAGSRRTRAVGQGRLDSLKTAHYATSLPGAPDGKYVVLEYARLFSEQELRGGNRDSDVGQRRGVARVSGYYIK